MSSAPKQSFTHAKAWAEKLEAALSPHCEQLVIAGSIRRQKPEIGDIEIVCIPKEVSTGLFGGEFVRVPEFAQIVNKMQFVRGQAGTGKAITRFWLEAGMNVDIFCARPLNWGYILALRTGSSEFNQYTILPRLKRMGYTLKDGWLYYRSETTPTPVPTEVELFRLMGLDWVEPSQRVVSGPVPSCKINL